MDEDESFIGRTKGLKKIQTSPNSAYMDKTIEYSNEYKTCKIEFIPWQQAIGFKTIPLMKSSPYK